MMFGAYVLNFSKCFSYVDFWIYKGEIATTHISRTCRTINPKLRLIDNYKSLI